MNELLIEDFFCVSLNYKDLTLNQREEIVKEKYHKALMGLREQGKLDAYVPLLTCLRIEFYIQASENSIAEVLSLFRRYSDHVHVYQGEEAIAYLYRVTCGFESIIKGEDEVLSQVKKAYEEAAKKEWTSTLVNVLMNKAIALGKKVRTVSKISHNTQSLQATVVKMLRETFKDNLANKRVLIIGIGDLAEKIMELLIGQVDTITICNRTADKIQPLLSKHDIVGIHYKNKYTFIPENDIIICATSAPHGILFYDDLKIRLTDGKQRVFMDLAVPRDIEEKCKCIEGVELIDLDQCWDAYNKCTEARMQYEEKYAFLLEEQLRKTREWVYYKKCN